MVRLQLEDILVKNTSLTLYTNILLGETSKAFSFGGHIFSIGFLLLQLEEELIEFLS